MANIVITKTNKRLNIDLGAYSLDVGEAKQNGHISKFEVSLSKSNDFIILTTRNHIRLVLKDSASSANAYTVDLVAGVAPSSTPDLYNKIIAILEDV